ncbi:cytochrome c1 [Microvirga tunisiensis]|uniref:Cytochrome c1 n=2 Tax=Pannonibacter tanglangensis TaxID=2750084 RepID=A0ABW9ZEJ4_9HYPH|nr:MULTISPECIES: cytochrome c1 [unclassified Pannonibacter]NBN63245.1 cytochrome c1 [Pannonibacter sp. XCT-34]NBN76883.1 cytochrome c1 [Pannonibacter sp. XCT-53]
MRIMIKTARALVAAVALAASAPAFAAGKDVVIERQQWSFAGPFGQFDQAQLQRGFKVYREVCASCHGLNLLSFRNLAQPGGPGFTEDQAKAIAAEYTVTDGPNADGDMFERPAILADRFPSPFPNEQAARAANGGAYPPDFSLIAKARAAKRGFPWFVFDPFTQYAELGPDYLYALLTGYEENVPEGVVINPGQYYNPKFLSGNAIGMAPPLSDDIVEYTDGTPQTVDQYARDISAFLMWAAEPKLEERKELGFRVMVFLLVFASLLYFTKQKIWRNVAH